MAVIRWDPVQEMKNLQESINRFLGVATERPWVPAVDVIDTADAWIVKAEVAGLQPEDLRVEVTENVLTIRGERGQEEEHEGRHVRSAEWHYGAFERSIPLPAGAKSDEVNATIANGVLEVRVAKNEQVKPKQIDIVVKDAPVQSVETNVD